MSVDSRIKPHIHRYLGRWFVTGPAAFRGRRTIAGPAVTIHAAFRAYRAAIGELV